MNARIDMAAAFVAVLYDEIENNTTLSNLDMFDKSHETDRDDVAYEYNQCVEAAAQKLGLPYDVEDLAGLYEWADEAHPAIAEFLTEGDDQ